MNIDNLFYFFFAHHFKKNLFPLCYNSIIGLNLIDIDNGLSEKSPFSFINLEDTLYYLKGCHISPPPVYAAAIGCNH